MVTLPGFLLRHEITVEAYEGESAYGPQYGAPVVVACFLDAKTRLVRSPGGDQVVSSATVYCQPDAVSAPPKSRVTLPDDRVTTIIASHNRDGGGLPTPDHLEIQLE